MAAGVRHPLRGEAARDARPTHWPAIAAWARCASATRRWRQRQHDVYGSVVLAATQLFFDQRLAAPGDAAAVRAPRARRRSGLAHARPARCRPVGIPRPRRRAHLFERDVAGPPATGSRGSPRTSALADRARLLARARRRKCAQSILEARRGREHGHFVDASTATALDASLLLLADLGFVDAGRSALRRHRRRDRQRRCADGDHLFRYVVPDDFGTPETSFTICTFWYVDALAAIGRMDEARAMFEQLLARRNPLGLLSEDIASGDRRAVGQLPADLFAGRPDQRGDAAVAQLGKRAVRLP